MKQKPRVPEESRERPGETGANRYPLPNDGSERRPMRVCEISSVRTSGRFATRAREPRLPKPKELYVSVVDRGGVCADDVSCLTRGGPPEWMSDNTDRVIRREAERWIDAPGGVRRTHSSRKTACRRRAWRHGQRRKQAGSAEERAKALLRWRQRGEHRDVLVSIQSRTGSGQEKAEPCTYRRERISPRESWAWPPKPGRKAKEAEWNN